MQRLPRLLAAFVACLTVLVAVPSSADAAAPAPFDWWSRSSIQQPVHVAAGLNDVVAIGDSDAWAVGNRAITSNEYEAVVVRWDGSLWSPVGSWPAGSGFQAVAARSSDDVFVGGSIGTTDPLVFHFDGSSWTELPDPAGLRTIEQLQVVGAVEVWAVGPTADGARRIWSWDGATWSEVPLPTFPDATLLDIQDLEAKSATNVWASGMYWDTVTQQNGAVVIRWNGTAWSNLDAPAGFILGTIGVVNASDGYVTAGRLVAGQPITEILHRVGSTWTTQSLPDGGSTSVSELAATSASEVWGVGEVSDSGSRPIFLHFDGATWEAWRPLVTTAAGSLSRLSFSSTSSGVAVGAVQSGGNWDMLTYSFGSKIVASASPDPAAFGAPVTVDGTLSYQDGSSAAGVTIQVERVDRDGVVTALPDIGTTAGGSFSFVDTPATVGANTYRLTSVSSGGHPPAVGETAVTVSRRTTTLSLLSKAATVTWGKETTLTARLGGFEPDTKIAIWRLKPDGGRALVVRAIVDARGAVRANVDPRENTRYEAESLGDDTWEPAQTVMPITVGVAPRVTATMLRAYTTVDGYRLYHYDARCPDTGRGCPRFVGDVIPTHTKCMVVTFQVRTGDGWATISDECFKPDEVGDVRLLIVYRNRKVIGQRYRLRSAFQGDRDHEPAASHWAYFRVTK